MNKLEKFIPSFDELYSALCDTVKAAQGTKGYIDTRNQDGKCDSIFGIEWNYYEEMYCECKIAGIRVRNNEVSVLTHNIHEKGIEDECFQKDDLWQSLKYSDIIYPQTLLQIAEVLFEYIP